MVANLRSVTQKPGNLEKFTDYHSIKFLAFFQKTLEIQVKKGHVLDCFKQ